MKAARHWLAGLVLLAGAAQAQAQLATAPHSSAPEAAQLDYALQPRRVAENTWVIEGAVADFSRDNGCNIINTGFIATGEGVVVINTGPSRRYGEQQRAAIERVTREPVVRVINLNLHPDYFFGNQAWADRPTQALAGSIAGMRAEGAAYADNLYRLCGDWMKGTEAEPAREPVLPQTLRLGRHALELRRFQGHTDDDLVLMDHSTGVVFAGGLVFASRVPTTPHADVPRWLTSLDALEAWMQASDSRLLVPSHGPVRADRSGLAQTRDWLRWLDAQMRAGAERGLDLSEMLAMPVPARFASWAAQPAEWQRSLTQWYPVHERRALERPAARQP